MSGQLPPAISAATIYIHPKMWKNLVAMETALAFAFCWGKGFLYKVS